MADTGRAKLIRVGLPLTLAVTAGVLLLWMAIAPTAATDIWAQGPGKVLDPTGVKQYWVTRVACADAIGTFDIPRLDGCYEFAARRNGLANQMRLALLFVLGLAGVGAWRMATFKD